MNAKLRVTLKRFSRVAKVSVAAVSAAASKSIAMAHQKAGERGAFIARARR